MHLRSEGFGLITRSVPYAQADWDENDAAREQALPLDPMSGTLDFVPSLAVPGATLDAKNGQVLTDEELMEAHRLRAEAAGLLDRARTAPDLEAVLTQRRAYFDGACARAASAVAAARQGGRNRSLFVEAAGLARFRYEPDLCVTRATLGDVLAVPARACGLSDAEARATLDSAWRRGDGARYKPPMPEHLSLDDETRRLARAARAVERGQASGPPRPGHVRSQRTRDVEVDGDGVVVEGPRAPLTDAEAAQVEVEVREVGGAVLRAACGGRVRLDVRDYDFDLQESRIYAALAAKSVRVYQRDGVLMRQEDASGDMPSHLRPVPVEVLETEISSVVTWYKERTDRMGRTHEDGAPMPARYPRALVQRRHHPGIREARFLLTHPATVGGRLVLREGYDAASRTLYLPTRPVVIPPVKEAPTKDEARAALRELVSVFDEFVFEGAGGLSAALSLLLTQLARPEVETEFVPYYLITTTTPGTGKGTLVEAINGIVEGTTGLYPARPSSSLEEEHKQYMTWAMGGRSGMVYFDNIKSGTSVGSPALDAILTGGGRIEGRKLGANENYQGRLSVTFVGTGNNVSISGDLARRLVIIRLALPPGVSPAARTFKRDLRAYVLAERPRLLHAAFTVMAAYRAAGSPLDKTLRPHPSFSEWSRVARNPLVWLGMPDPVEEAQRQAGSADLQVVYLRELLSALHTISKGAPFTAHHLCRYWKEACEESDALSEQLVVACEQLDFADGARWNKARVTATLGAYQGRAFDGYALMVDQPFVRWRAERAQ
jgi:putative DNA primase/helicase